MSKEHKVGDLVYDPTIGLGMIKRIESENNGGYPYLVEWYYPVANYIPSHHNDQEIQYFKKCLGEYMGRTKEDAIN